MTETAWRCPGCQRTEEFVQAWAGGQTAWCEAGMSGAHLEQWLTAGCRAHGQFGPRLRLVGRSCPAGCDWSRQEGNER